MQADIVHELNDALGTDLDLETGWDEFLPGDAASAPAPEAVRANGGSEAATLLGGDLPSEDESDFSFRCGGPLFSGMHASLTTSSQIRGTTENEPCDGWVGLCVCG